MRVCVPMSAGISYDMPGHCVHSATEAGRGCEKVCAVPIFDLLGCPLCSYQRNKWFTMVYSLPFSIINKKIDKALSPGLTWDVDSYKYVWSWYSPDIQGSLCWSLYILPAPLNFRPNNCHLSLRHSVHFHGTKWQERGMPFIWVSLYLLHSKQMCNRLYRHWENMQW